MTKGGKTRIEEEKDAPKDERQFQASGGNCAFCGEGSTCEHGKCNNCQNCNRCEGES